MVLSVRIDKAKNLPEWSDGLLLFGERSNWQKILAVLGILAGIAITVMG